MAVLRQIRNALSGVVIVDQNDGLRQDHDSRNQFAANKEQSSRYETEEPMVTVSSYDPDRW